jgi:hypothetical protein
MELNNIQRDIEQWTKNNSSKEKDKSALSIEYEIQYVILPMDKVQNNTE